MTLVLRIILETFVLKAPQATVQPRP